MSLPFPNVPNLPGVPAIPRSPQAAVSTVLTLATSQITGALAQSSQVASLWGIFDSDGNQVVSPDSFVDFDNRNEWEVSSFPQQQGAFSSYNKVQVPFEIAIRMTKGGSVDDRTQFLQDIASIAGDTNLYTIWTPEQTYDNVNITRYENTRRGAGGAFFLDVDVYFIQIVEVSAQYQSSSASPQNQNGTTNAQDPSAQPAVNQGNVQGQTPDAQTQAAYNAFLGALSG